MRQVAADGESQTCAAILTGGAGIGLLEFLEDAGKGFWADADASIGDRDAQVFPIPAGGKENFAFMGKFGGVAQKIEDDLPDFILVGIDDIEGSHPPVFQGLHWA